LVVLQDGFLPENYSSYYLKFFKNVDKFFCWDESSKKIFAKFSLPVEIAPFLDMKLPAIKMKNYPVNTIVVLTSGAGDWTALKNRSDQDLEVEAFAKVAKEFPNINIIFRCHPLWAHKKHQGTNSINRVDKYYKSLNLKNIRISEESLKQADYFKKTGNLWIEKKSADKDINEGNLFFGEHSIAMIDAAKKSKIFASVNLTNRRNFFINYSKLGFPNLTSVEEVIDFIKKIREKNEVINSFNKAVEKYNEQFKN